MAITYNGTKIDKIVYNGTEVFGNGSKILYEAGKTDLVTFNTTRGELRKEADGIYFNHALSEFSIPTGYNVFMVSFLNGVNLDASEALIDFTFSPTNESPLRIVKSGISWTKPKVFHMGTMMTGTNNKVKMDAGKAYGKITRIALARIGGIVKFLLRRNRGAKLCL